jgi:hypothetical protein
MPWVPLEHRDEDFLRLSRFNACFRFIPEQHFSTAKGDKGWKP